MRPRTNPKPFSNWGFKKQNCVTKAVALLEAKSRSVIENIMHASPVPSVDAPIHVLLVEDYDFVRQGLQLLLNRHSWMEIVGAASNRAQALQLTARTQPDVVLLDVGLGEDDGLQMLPELLELGAKNVIVFTGTVDAEIHHSALALGAKAVVQKGESEEQLADCIRRVYGGEVVQFEAETPKIARLSKTERDTVALLCAGAKNERILSQLGLSPSELGTTLKSIQSKLEVPDPVALVVYAFRHGLARAGATE